MLSKNNKCPLFGFAPNLLDILADLIYNNAMANSSNKNDNLQINPIITPANSGLCFSIATIAIIAMSLIFTVVIAIIATAKGVALEQFNASLQGSFVYNVFAFGLSSVALCLALLVFAGVKKIRPFSMLPLKKTGWKYWVIALLLTFGLLFGFTELNNLFVSLLEKIGYSKPDMTLQNEKWYHLAVWLVVAAAMPAFFEECVFRGYLLEGLKQYGTLFAVIVGGLFFSIFHQNPQQTPYQFICGMAFTLLAIKSGSMLPCIAMHFANNATILITDFCSLTIGKTAGIILTVAGILCFLGGIIWLMLDKKSTPSTEENPVKPTKMQFFLFSAAGLAVCVLMWLTDLFTYIGG
jgi:membrane protease YdiL (CAAX protease family)